MQQQNLAPVHRPVALEAYGQATDTVPRLRQLVLLHDAAIRRLRDARQAIEDGRVERRFDATTAVGAIIDALQGSLDFERGGEVARLLDRVYVYLGMRLVRINVANDASVCDELIERLSELRGAWSALADGSPAEPAPPPGALATTA